MLLRSSVPTERPRRAFLNASARVTPQNIVSTTSADDKQAEPGLTPASSMHHTTTHRMHGDPASLLTRSRRRPSKQGLLEPARRWACGEPPGPRPPPDQRLGRCSTAHSVPSSDSANVVAPRWQPSQILREVPADDRDASRGSSSHLEHDQKRPATTPGVN